MIYLIVRMKNSGLENRNIYKTMEILILFQF